MEILHRILVPEVTIYLIGILGLLALWQYHQNLVLAGRIYAVDFWDMSGIRMLLHATIRDGRACHVCRIANGTVFLPSLAAKKNFSALHGSCVSSQGCRCLVVGLYGAWPEAGRLVQTLRKRSKQKLMRMSEKDLLELFEEPWKRGISGATDRLTTDMVKGLYLEGRDLRTALACYRRVVDQASGVRELRLVVPAYLRLADVLERVGRSEEALEVIEQFEKRFSWKRAVFYYPTDAQREEMSILKSRLPGGGEKAQPSEPALRLQGRAKRAAPSVWR